MLTAHEVVYDRVDGAREVTQPMGDEREVGRTVARILQQIGISATKMATCHRGQCLFRRGEDKLVDCSSMNQTEE